MRQDRFMNGPLLAAGTQILIFSMTVGSVTKVSIAGRSMSARLTPARQAAPRIKNSTIDKYNLITSTFQCVENAPFFFAFFMHISFTAIVRGVRMMIKITSAQRFADICPMPVPVRSDLLAASSE